MARANARLTSPPGGHMPTGANKAARFARTILQMGSVELKQKALCAARAVAALFLGSMSAQSLAGVTSAAQSPCMSAVNKNYGGKVKQLRVVSSEFSQANPEVVINADGKL
jgi:hypothetical protein